MARYSGLIGFLVTQDNGDGVWQAETIEKKYYGDVYKNKYKTAASDGVNDNIDIRNEISIVADTFARENYRYMRYLYWMGAKWKITDVSVEYPRLTLTIGGVWNG